MILTIKKIKHANTDHAIGLCLREVKQILGGIIPRSQPCRKAYSQQLFVFLKENQIPAMFFKWQHMLVFISAEEKCLLSSSSNTYKQLFRIPGIYFCPSFPPPTPLHLILEILAQDAGAAVYAGKSDASNLKCFFLSFVHAAYFSFWCSHL